MLSICTPSNRRLDESKLSIELIALASKLYAIESIIFDNSRDQSKSDYHQKNNNITIYNNNAPSNGADNWKACINTAKGDYILMVGDDDHVHFLSDPNIILNDLDSDYIGLKPTHNTYTSSLGILSTDTFSNDENTAKERVLNYFVKNGGKNLGFYGIYKREYFQDLLNDFYDNHPTKAGNTDWALSLALISMGKIKSTPKILFNYNIDNWQNSASSLNSNIKIFESANLSVETQEIQNGLTGLDSFAMISRQKSPLDFTEKFDAAIFALEVYYSAQLNHLINLKNESLQDRINLSIKQLINNSANPTDKIFNLLNLVNIWEPNLSLSYLNYFEKTIDRKILAIIMEK